MNSQNRYGLSALSKQNKKFAVPEEIMVDKLTGEIQIKGPTGNIFSYDYIARLNNQINIFTTNSQNADVYGYMYEIEIPEIDLPAVIPLDTNLLTSKLDIADNKFKYMMFGIDCDVIDPNTTLSKLDHSEIIVELVIEYALNGEVKNITMEDTLYVTNRRVLRKSTLPKEATDFKLVSVKILSNDELDGNEHFILHSLLTNIELQTNIPPALAGEFICGTFVAGDYTEEV